MIVAPGPATDGLRIGLLGGSFNPAHGGHVHISLTALKRLPLDYVWWLVSPGNPLKDPATMAPLAARLAAARKLARHPRIVVSALERDLGTVYTVDTVRALKRRFPHLEFCWLMGSDNLMQFHLWRNWRALAAAVPVAVVLRPGSEGAPLCAPAMPWLKAKGRIRILGGARNAQSATAIRKGGMWP